MKYFKYYSIVLFINYYSISYVCPKVIDFGGGEYKNKKIIAVKRSEPESRNFLKFITIPCECII